MEGLAKSAPSPIAVAEPPQPIKTEQAMPSQVWEGVPMEVYKYFNVEFSDASPKHIEDMKVVLGYATSKGPLLPGDMLQKLEELQIRLGQPDLGRTRLSQMADWCRVRRTINDLRKQQAVMERGFRFS